MSAENDAMRGIIIVSLHIGAIYNYAFAAIVSCFQYSYNLSLLGRTLAFTFFFNRNKLSSMTYRQSP